MCKGGEQEKKKIQNGQIRFINTSQVHIYLHDRRNEEKSDVH